MADHNKRWSATRNGTLPGICRGMIRSLLKNWKLNSIAVFSLAIAMALSVVALSISNAILLRSPVAHDPERLVTLYTVARNCAQERFSYLDYQSIRDHNRRFSGVTALNLRIL